MYRNMELIQIIVCRIDVVFNKSKTSSFYLQVFTNKPKDMSIVRKNIFIGIKHTFFLTDAITDIVCVS